MPAVRKQTHDPYRTASLDVPQLAETWADDPMPAPRPLNVLAHVDRYPPHVNAGAEWYLHHALRHLAEVGHRVRVATVVPDADDTGRGADLEGVERWSHTIVDTLADDADVLVGHLLWTREAVSLAHDRGLPLVYVLHNDMQIDHWTLTPENVTVLVANSRWVSDAVPWSGPSVVVRPPVLLADYRIDADAGTRPFVTLVNPNPDKGAHVFYSLAHTQPRRQFMAVEGGYGQQLRPRHGDRNVAWHRPTPRMRDEVYARTRVLLVPSRYESWGRVAVEAMAAGCVVVAHPTPGLLEACGDAAVYVDRDDLAGWQTALDMLDDRVVFAGWSAKSRDRAARLDFVARADLRVWEAAIRVAASTRGVPSDA